jgi:argininosuccinate synthase
MRDIEAFFTHSQERVTGTVTAELLPFRFALAGIESEFDLMKSKLGQYGEMNTGWSGQDVRGFTKIFGNQLKIYHTMDQGRGWNP